MHVPLGSQIANKRSPAKLALTSVKSREASRVWASDRVPVTVHVSDAPLAKLSASTSRSSEHSHSGPVYTHEPSLIVAKSW